jgi:hypothetical protein
MRGRSQPRPHPHQGMRKSPGKPAPATSTQAVPFSQTGVDPNNDPRQLVICF